MRTLTTIALATAITLSTWASPRIVGAEERLTMGQRHHLVKYQGLSGVDWSVTENLLTIRAAFHRYGMGDGVARCVAMRESGYNEDARNLYSGAAGLFQHLPYYWAGRVAAYNRSAYPNWKVHSTSPFNARANALVTAFMVKHGGWGPWGGGC